MFTSKGADHLHPNNATVFIPNFLNNPKESGMVPKEKQSLPRMHLISTNAILAFILTQVVLKILGDKINK